MVFKRFLSRGIRYLTGGNVTPNFKWAEFDCKDGTRVPKEFESNVLELAKQLEIIRAEAGNKPVTVNSGYRTPDYNRLKGGVKNSYHLTAKAADIVIKGMTPIEVHQLIKSLMKSGKITKGGLGLYSTFVHYDIRGVESYWVG